MCYRASCIFTLQEFVETLCSMLHGRAELARVQRRRQLEQFRRLPPRLLQWREAPVASENMPATAHRPPTAEPQILASSSPQAGSAQLPMLALSSPLPSPRPSTPPFSDNSRQTEAEQTATAAALKLQALARGRAARRQRRRMQLRKARLKFVERLSTVPKRSAPSWEKRDEVGSNGRGNVAASAVAERPASTRRTYGPSSSIKSATESAAEVAANKAAAAIKAAANEAVLLRRAQQVAAEARAAETASERAAKQAAREEAARVQREQLVHECKRACAEAESAEYANELRDCVSRLRALIERARKLQVVTCESLLFAAFESANRRAIAIDKNMQLIRDWERAHEESAVVTSGLDSSSSSQACGPPAGAPRAAPEPPSSARRAVAPSPPSKGGGAQYPAPPAAGTGGSPSADGSRGGRMQQRVEAAAALKYGTSVLASLLPEELLRRSGGGRGLSERVLGDLPPATPVPSASSAIMRQSRRLACMALSRDLRRQALKGSGGGVAFTSSLDVRALTALELRAAVSAFKSWHHESWYDPRTSTRKTKPPKCWTIEQYAQLVRAHLRLNPLRPIHDMVKKKPSERPTHS